MESVICDRRRPTRLTCGDDIAKQNAVNRATSERIRGTSQTGKRRSDASRVYGCHRPQMSPTGHRQRISPSEHGDRATAGMHFKHTNAGQATLQFRRRAA